MTPEQKLQSLGISLPNAPKPGAVYQPAVISGNHIYLSGHVSLDAEGKVISGKLGSDYSIEQGQEFAKIVALLMIATLKDNLDDLSRVKKLVKTLGMVNSSLDFTSHHLVINGYSEMMRDIFGPEKGVGARSAVGMILPLGAAVEIEAIFEIEE
ncbi:MAG: RidA family protein [Bacteroidota bacterium]